VERGTVCGELALRLSSPVMIPPFSRRGLGGPAQRFVCSQTRPGADVGRGLPVVIGGSTRRSIHGATRFGPLGLPGLASRHTAMWRLQGMLPFGILLEISPMTCDARTTCLPTMLPMCILLLCNGT